MQVKNNSFENRNLEVILLEVLFHHQSLLPSDNSSGTLCVSDFLQFHNKTICLEVVFENNIIHYCLPTLAKVDLVVDTGCS